MVLLACVAGVATPILHTKWVQRTIAKNEVAAVDACKRFAEAQERYRRTDHDHDGVVEYASDLAELARINYRILDLAAADMDSPKVVAFQGYVFRILKGQSAVAVGGRRNYGVDNNMTLGYALVAYPYDYNRTGRNSFMISHNGTIYKQDLGDAKTRARADTEFDPGAWFDQPTLVKMMHHHE